MLVVPVTVRPALGLTTPDMTLPPVVRLMVLFEEDPETGEIVYALQPVKVRTGVTWEKIRRERGHV